ncbi:tail fiber assembly protein [Enterobacteriaceae bacterium RIT714]|nr:tail fiber assembly protein [Enterobacteriaceae bacterium RIT714]
MNYLWSAKNSVFILEEMKPLYEEQGWELTDVLLLDDQTVTEFMGEQPAGKIRITGADGLPVWAEIPPASKAELMEAAEAEKQARIALTNDVINRQQWPSRLQLGRLSEQERVSFNAMLDYLDALERVDTENAPDISWPEPPEG